MLAELENIGLRRKRIGLTQMEMARKTNVSQSLITKIESGKINPSYSVAKKLFEILEEMEDTRSIKAEKLMSKDLCWVKHNDTIGKAVKMMTSCGVSQLPVFNDNTIVGILTEKNIFGNVIKGGEMKDLAKMHVEDMMEEPYPKVGRKAPMALVAELLKHNNGVLVMESGIAHGIITRSDVLRTISDNGI